MSSPTQPHPCEAVVRRSGEVTGPVRLPLKDAQSFIETFNRLYRSAGLSIAESPASGAARPPEDTDDAADRH